jgi:hypothetical protein
LAADHIGVWFTWEVQRIGVRLTREKKVWPLVDLRDSSSGRAALRWHHASMRRSHE